MKPNPVFEGKAGGMNPSLGAGAGATATAPSKLELEEVVA